MFLPPRKTEEPSPFSCRSSLPPGLWSFESLAHRLGHGHFGGEGVTTVAFGEFQDTAGGSLQSLQKLC